MRFTRGPKLLIDALNSVLEEVAKNKIMPSSTIQVRRSSAGTILDISLPSGRATPFTPFQIFTKAHASGGVPDGTTDITLYPGALNQVIASNMFSVINMTINAMLYVILTCTSDGYAVTSYTWSVVTSQPTPLDATASTPPSTFYVLIGVIVYNSPGFTVYQIVDTDLTAAPEIWITVSNPTPVPFASPTLNYYAWGVTES